MATRDQTRQELKDLAKLAVAMAKEPSKPPTAPEASTSGITGSRVTVPPAVASMPTPPGVTLRPPAFGGGASDPTGAHPGARATTLRSLIPAPNSGWRGAWAVIAGATLAAAMVGGLLLGKSLTSHSAASGPDRASNAAAPSPESAVIPALAPAPAVTPSTLPQPAAPAPAATDTAGAAQPGADNSFTVRAPRPVHHAELHPALKPGVASPAAPASASATKAATPAAKAPAAHPATHDSLDELIRKAAAGN